MKETLDPIRKENLLLTINLVDKLLNDICLTATSKDQDEPSAKEIRFIAYNYLSQLNNEMKKYNKEALISTSSIKLIGYKIKDNYIEYFKNMVTTSIPVHSFSKQPVTFTVGGQWYEFTKKAGVLDMWFEPVYEERSLPVINGHQPFVFDTCDKKHVRYYNIDFSINDIKDIVNMMNSKNISSVTLYNKLTVSQEEFNQILNYFN